MHSRTAVLVAAGVLVVLTIKSTVAEDPAPKPPLKLDKNLRKALLRVLTNLENESAEQKLATEGTGHTEKIDGDDSSKSNDEAKPFTRVDEEMKELKPIHTIFSFDGLSNDDDEPPSEENLQNSTFTKVDKYAESENGVASDESKRNAFQAHDTVLSDKKSPSVYETNLENEYVDQPEARSVKTSGGSSNALDSGTVEAKSSKSSSESLIIDSSNGIAKAHSLLAAPRPTVASPIVDTIKLRNTTIRGSSTLASKPNRNIDDPKSTATNNVDGKEQTVKIFQAPLVAAFTVQQDERGIPKSVVPIYRPNGDGQALTLQEQLEFKQQLLEKQLAELQAQQVQQAQYLVRQRQIYEDQLLQKQHQRQMLYAREQNRLKRLQEEQARLKLLEEQQNYQSQTAKTSQPFAFGLQNQQYQQQQPQQNALTSFQSSPTFKQSNVNIQPSLALELPKPGSPTSTFQSNYHEQLRLQQLLQQQQQQHQVQLQHQLQHQQVQQPQRLQQHQPFQQQQQRHQQSFPGFPIDFQPPVSGPALRFNRQEALGSVGNFGFNNDNRVQSGHASSTTSPRNHHFSHNPQLSRGPQNIYNPYQQQQSFVRQSSRSQTPARQIQHLLHQSGVVANLGNPQNGNGGQEDLNIVSKVLALNVGALTNTKNTGRYNHFTSST